MANNTSRIILILAVPSIFGLLGVLFFKRRKLNSSGSTEREVKPLSHLCYYQPKSPMKLLKNQEPSSVESSYSEMQLKESESVDLTSNCNGVSHSSQLKQQLQDSVKNSVKQVHISNGVSHQNLLNGHCNEILAAEKETEKNPGDSLQGIKIRDAKSSLDEQISNFDQNVNQNGLKKQAKKTQFTSNNVSLNTNGVSEKTLHQKPDKLDPNGELIQTANGISRIPQKTKSKKKSKGKLHESIHSCSKSSINGCKTDSTTLVNEDRKSGLSNGVAALTINDEASFQEQTLTIDDIHEMSAGRCFNVQQVVSAQVQTVSSQLDTSISVNNESTLTVPTSVFENDTCVPANVVFDDAKKECDTNDQSSLDDAHCSTPESGRSSDSSSESIENIHVDINGHADLVASGSLGDSMLASPGAAYCDSVGSNDSGRGGSELQYGFEPQPASMVFEFEIPSDHCGMLIGKRGHHVNFIKEKANACIWIRNFPYEKDKKIVTVAGDENEIKTALKLIRKKFPLKDYPEVTLEQSNLVNSEIVLPASLKLAFPEGVEFQVVLSATVNAGHFFVQLPTHPSYHALPPFTMSMISLYTHCHSPLITNLTVGNVVAAPVGDGWFRAEVIEIFPENDSCKLKYLDYGGYQVLPISALRQINIEFMQMPFQATECYLANVTCHDELGWTEESKIAFESLAQGQILSAYVAGVADDGTPCLYLYKVTGATNTFINQALVEAGYLRWVTFDQLEG